MYGAALFTVLNPRFFEVSSISSLELALSDVISYYGNMFCCITESLPSKSKVIISLQHLVHSVYITFYALCSRCTDELGAANEIMYYSSLLKYPMLCEDSFFPFISLMVIDENVCGGNG